MSDLASALNDRVIRRLAGESYYQRGLDYFRGGHVIELDEGPSGVSATVGGNSDYAVRLSSEEGVLDYSCDCPLGSDGEFCKHCVAAALAWLNPSETSVRTKGRSRTKKLTLADAEGILLNEESDTLVQTLLGWAKDDERLRERILLFAARRSGPETGVAAARQAFERAIRVHDFVHYREAGAWARGVDDAIDHIAQLLQDGVTSGVLELCESALKSLAAAMGSIDDSDGYLSTLRDRLEDIHLTACREARPDPVALAQRLFQVELNSDLELFYGAASRYSDVLGEEGMQAYRKLAEGEWKKVPARAAGSRSATWSEDYRITRIMETLAEVSGDVEQMVSVLSRDLSGAYSYLQIAEAYRKAGQHDKALEWAEKGLKTFPEHTDIRLREFAAEEYHRRRRHEDAMNPIWAEFRERPYLETYQKLEHHAKKAPAKNNRWAEWRERALAEVRQHIATAQEAARRQGQARWGPSQSDHSTLVQIFLYEKDFETAWHEAQAGGCRDDLWLELAAIREKNHPEDAAAIYVTRATKALSTIRDGRYEQTVDWLVRTAALMKRMGRSHEFAAQLNGLRLQYKIKRNFTKLVERKKKSLYL